MRWDEDRFGLEYDLDLFNIVAVDDFNMGAMENKSLNLFNSRLVLATPQTATDTGLQSRIEGVIGHEYFHNWTGNGVTCRDWFQLSLKEGLTVFRDQEFSADVNSRAVKRIGDVRHLRDAQFAELASPMRTVRRELHEDRSSTPSRVRRGPSSHAAHVARGIRVSTGHGRRSERHDGSAATVDDFFDAMSDANGVDISRLEELVLASRRRSTVRSRASYDASRANLLPDARADPPRHARRRWRRPLPAAHPSPWVSSPPLPVLTSARPLCA